MHSQSRDVIAFLPLRGGSKSIPDKNMALIADRPLMYWVLDAAVNSRAIERVYVCTDSEAIGNLARSYGHPRVEVVGRSPESATDSASTEFAMLEFAASHAFQHMVLIQATSPLLTSEHLDAGLALYRREQADSLLSVVRQKRFIWSLQADGSAAPLNYDPVKRPRRQDHDGYLVENGAFYVCRRDFLMTTRSRLSGRMLAYEMPPETYLELDEPSDWLLVEALLRRRKAIAFPEARLRGLKLVLSDVDGVLTDAGMYYSEHGDELKKFNTRDGKGFERLRHLGIKTGIVTAENTRIVAARAKKLGLDYVYQGIRDKGAILEQLCRDLALDPGEVAYIGDDLNDLEILGKVGFAAAPSDAVDQIKAAAHYVCRAKGGEGCVRELADLIISAHRPPSLEVSVESDRGAPTLRQG